MTLFRVRDVLRHVALEILLGTGDVHPSAAVVEDLVHGEQLSLTLVHLHAVVGQRPSPFSPRNESLYA